MAIQDWKTNRVKSKEADVEKHHQTELDFEPKFFQIGPFRGARRDAPWS
jgi:hypothetical protein